jgi:hypothetical protein
MATMVQPAVILRSGLFSVLKAVVLGTVDNKQQEQAQAVRQHRRLTVTILVMVQQVVRMRLVQQAMLLSAPVVEQVLQGTIQQCQQTVSQAA